MKLQRGIGIHQLGTGNNYAVDYDKWTYHYEQNSNKLLIAETPQNNPAPNRIYTYDANGNLSSVRFPKNRTV